MAQVIVKNLNLGGIADSDYLGGNESVADMVGLDIHSEAGVIKVNQKLTKESGSTIDDFVKARVACSDGKTYMFGSTNGKIWSRDSSGTYTLEATASPAAGSAGITDAAEYQGYIYYAMQNRLGRVQIGSAWSTRNDSWATFTNGNATYHPMRVLNIVLYIGDGNLVAQVDAGTFSANALDLETQYIIKSFGVAGTDLTIGTYVSSNVNLTTRFRWNTWGVSFTSADPIPEVGINAYLEADNYSLWNCGTKGNIYIDDGTNLDLYKQVKGNFDNSSKQGLVHPNAVLNFHGMPLFGFSDISGGAANCGVYSLARTNRNYPFVLNMEYVLSTGHLTGVEIGMIVGIGDKFLVSWKDTNGGTTYGVDVLDLTAKYNGAYFTTRVIAVAREVQLNHGTVHVPYRSLPTNTTITVSRKVNNGTMTAFDTTEHETDTDRAVVRTKVDINDANKVQVKVAMTASGNTAPEVEAAIIDINT